MSFGFSSLATRQMLATMMKRLEHDVLLKEKRNTLISGLLVLEVCFHLPRERCKVYSGNVPLEDLTVRK
jgi:hypothetical protein